MGPALMNAIYVLWLRQLKRYVRSRTRILASMAQPLLFLIAFGYGLGHVFAAAGRGNYIDFLAPGIIGMSLIFTSVFAGMEVIWDRQFGFLKETLVAPVSRTAIMVGRVLGSATTSTAQGVIVLLVTLLFGFHPMDWALVPAAIAMMALIALVFSAGGLLVASFVADMQAFPLIMNFLVMPIFFLSGAMFPLDGLPPALSLVTRIDPLAYGVDGLRTLLLGQSHFGLPLDIAVLSAAALVLIAGGSYAFRRMQV